MQASLLLDDGYVFLACLRQKLRLQHVAAFFKFQAESKTDDFLWRLFFA